MKRFLVAQLARFGDLLQTGRLLSSLREEAAAEGGEVHLCLDRSLAGLARLLYPDVILHPVKAHGGGGTDDVAANRAAFAALARLDCDRVLNLNFSGLNFALAGLFEPERVRGYRVWRGQRLKDQWCELAFRWARRRREQAINLVDFWAGFTPEHRTPPAAVNPVAAPKGGGVGVVLAGRHARRSLPPAVLAPLVAVLADASAGPVLLLGTDAEKPLARALGRELRPALAERTRDLTGKTSLADLLEIVGGLSVLLTPDTGLMHLAARLGTPVQALFLSSAWCFETGPYGLGHTIWQPALDCQPCLESQPCGLDVACLKPFAAPGFARLLGRSLAGRASPDLPAEGLIGYRSSLDELGADCEPFVGHDPTRDRRRAFRRLLANWLGLAESAGPGHPLAELLFQERDWLLDPRALPALSTDLPTGGPDATRTP